MASPIYDSIGNGYNNTRMADPYLSERIYDLLCPIEGGIYLDIGCGTGNYMAAMLDKGLNFIGIDPSEKMLAEAKAKCPDTRLILGKAESIPFDNVFFDGAIALFTTHHWSDLNQGLAELARVLKSGARAVFLSFTPEQMRGYWLNHYFPIMMHKSMTLVPERAEIEKIFLDNRFSEVFIENYFIMPELQDKFLYANKFRPEQYLLPEVRNGISSFTAFSDIEELEHGLVALEEDIRAGKITQIMQKYENDRGDYIFYIASR